MKETPASSPSAPERLDESRKAEKPNNKKLPPRASPEEIDYYDVTPQPLRSWCQHGERGKAADVVLVFVQVVVFFLLGAAKYALAVVSESLRFTGRGRILTLTDQENAGKKLASTVRSLSLQEHSTPASCAGGTERRIDEVEGWIRTPRTRFEGAHAAVDT